METLYDIVIVGGGPAGLSAAITARARNKEVLIISNPPQENPLAASKHVDNYPGMPESTGLHLLESMAAHANKLGAHSLQARTISIVPMQTTNEKKTETSFSVTTSSDFVQAKAVILACGTSRGANTIEGELEFLGRGVSYCATCDGMLFRNATVVVAGLSPEALDEANFLAELGATVHFVAKKIPHGLDTRIYPHTGTIRSIEGDTLGVSHVLIEEGQTQDAANKSKEATFQNKIEANGVFVLRPSVAPSTLLPGLELDEGSLKVDAKMHTNVDGVFAAGDCVGAPLQVAKAVGEGQVAALSAVEYLQAH